MECIEAHLITFAVLFTVCSVNHMFLVKYLMPACRRSQSRKSLFSFVIKVINSTTNGWVKNIICSFIRELTALGGLDPPPKPTGNPWCGSIRESSHANILCSICLCWRVCKQDGGGQVLFLMGCQLPLYTSLWIIGIPQETLWELGTLSLTRWTRH